LERHSVLVDHPDLYTATIAGRRLARKHAKAGSYTYPEGDELEAVAGVEGEV
jgi:hypothetical protein